MSSVYILKFRDGREEELWGHRGYYYVVKNGDLINFDPDPAWCPACQKVTICENLQSPEEIHEELRNLNDRQPPWHPDGKCPPTEKDIASVKEFLGNRLRLWSERTERSMHCLECGELGAVNFQYGKWAAHPGTGEEVFFIGAGIGSSTNSALRFFDPNGVDIKPTEEDEIRWSELINSNRVGVA